MANKTMRGEVAKYEDDREPKGSIKGTCSIEELLEQETNGYALAVGGTNNSEMTISGLTARTPDGYINGSPKFNLSSTDFQTINNNCVQNDDDYYVAQFVVTDVDESTGKFWLYASSASGEYYLTTFS
ncbi:hypothetical protein GF324_14235 [bacterium]|nr:hypothetical protein [bacterium]